MITYADLHIHSRYARACSPQLTPENIDLWCRIKGLGLVSTADFTHPKWLAELIEKLKPLGNGLYELKKSFRKTDFRFSPNNEVSVRFICGAEVACIYKHAGATRRVHHCLYAPSLEIAQKINNALIARGKNLKSDGRPILGLSSKDLLQLLLEIDERNVMIPAHAWTPWFAIFGSKSGYNSIEECFEELTHHIFAIETGLSSDPLMNWQISALDNVALVSNSDAHSLPNLGREATVFTGGELTYDNIIKAIRAGSVTAKRNKKNNQLPLTLTGTLEFFPDEGRYHYDGHKVCKVCWHPQETVKHKNLCTKCGRPVTVGVLSRVLELSDRDYGFKPPGAIGYTNLVELDKIIAEAQGVSGRKTKAVEEFYWKVVSTGSGELRALLELPVSFFKNIDSNLAEAINRLRNSKVAMVTPGYDGEYGLVRLFKEGEIKKRQQSSLF